MWAWLRVWGWVEEEGLRLRANGFKQSVPLHARGAQDKLWSGLKELADGIMTSATAVWHLQRVVAKKKVSAGGDYYGMEEKRCGGHRW